MPSVGSSSSLRRSKRLAAMVEEESLGVGPGSTIRKSKSSKAPSSKKKKKKAPTSSAERASRSAPKRTRGRPAGRSRGRGRARRKESQVIAKMCEKDVVGRMNLPTYLCTVPTDPLQSIVRMCSRRPHHPNWLSFLHASTASALVKAGGALADATSSMITDMEINAVPRDLFSNESAVSSELVSVWIAWQNKSSNCLKVSVHLQKQVHQLLKAAGNNLNELHLRVPPAHLLQISMWIKSYSKNSITKVVLGPTPYLHWNPQLRNDWLITSHHIYCLLNACPSIKILEIKAFILSLTVIGTIARHIHHIESFVVEDCVLEASLEPIWTALKDSLKNIRIEGVVEVNNKYAFDQLAQCNMLENVEIRNVIPNLFPPENIESTRNLFNKNVKLNINL